MKALRSAVQVCLLLLLISSSSASAATVTLSGAIQFSALDGSAQDSDGVVNGVFTVNGDLVLNGAINCNDDPPGPGHASACPIRLNVSGSVSLTEGSGIFAENRRGGGDGGDVVLTAGEDIVLRGPSGSLAGAVMSTGRTTGTDDRAGDITLHAGGRVEIEAGAAVSAGAHGGRAGDIEITAGDRVMVAGLIAAGPSRVVLPSALTGKVLDGGNGKQEGGSIIIRAQTSSEPGVRVEAGGIVVSQGEKGGAQIVRLEGCGIEVQGLVAAVARRDGPGRVVLRSGTTLLVDGRDLGTAGSRRGRVRADSTEGGASGFLVDLFAAGDVQVLGPAAASAPFAVSSTPGPEGPAGTGGTITTISLAGTLTGSAKAFDAGRSRVGNRGGTIDLRAKGAVTLDSVALQAVGDFATTNSSRKGGRIMVRSYQADVSWTFGTGDVRPTGTAVPAANRGSITLTACSGIDLTGSQFPVQGGPVLPFPEENDGVCSPLAPALPTGEPPLPVCNEPPVANGQVAETDEDTPITITLTGSDPNSDPLTFSIVTPPAHGSLGPLTSPTATSVQVVYTPALNYNGPDSFTFQVDDGHGGTDTATVTLTVKPVNDAPEVNAATFTLDENSPNGTAVGTVTFTDPDSGQSHTFSITNGNTGGAFAINPTTGEITVANSAALDFETTSSFSLTVQVTDDGSPALSGTAIITINLTDGNEAPVVNPAMFTVAENSPNSTGVGTVTFSDADAGQTHTFAIVAGDVGGAFAINASTGAITVANSSVLNFETTPSFSVTVQVTDDGSPVLSGTAVITINLTNVNEAPVVNPDAFTVNENSPSGTVVGTVTFTDPDVGQGHTFAITAGNTGGVFAINPATGEITVAGAINFEATPSFTLTVQVTDDGTPALSGSATVTVNVNNVPEPPTANPDSYDTIGNTLLQVAGSDTAEGPHVFVSGSLLANDSDPDVPSTLTVSLNSASPGAEVTVDSDGTFTYVPPAGATGTDTFTYNLSDGTFTVTATVTIHLRERVWYVSNDAEASGNGTSVAPFNAITAANLSDSDEDGDLADDLDSENDYIFIYFGDGTATNQSMGLLLEGGQHLLGEHVGLTVPITSGTFNGVDAPTSVSLVEATPGNRPQLDDTVADTIEGIAARDVVPVEIAGLNLGGNVNGIDWTTTAAFAGSGELVIRDNVIRSATNEGVDINLAGTGVTHLAFHNNNLTATGAALDIQETGAGALTITRFDNNVVSGDSNGAGLNVIGPVIFDATPGGALDPVSGGITVIGASGNPIAGSGLVLGNMTGALDFTDLDIFAGGAGVTVAGTGAFSGAAGTRVTVSSGVSIIQAGNGPGVDVSNSMVDLQLTTLTVSASPTTGVSLANVTGTFSAEPGSSITNTTGTDFAISGGTANVTYKGTITDDVGQLVSVSGATAGTKSFEGGITDGDDGDGSGVSLSGNTGATVRFSGGLVLSTGANAAFAATGGGTVEVCDENPCNGGATGALVNRITTTTGTALNVVNTTISANNLEFRSISVGTAASGPANGIVLNTTGASGGLKVKGSGSVGSGGTIQRAGTGISLTSTRNVSLSFMQLNDFTDFAIRGASVVNFDMDNSVINGTNGNDAAADEGSVRFSELTGSASISNSSISGSVETNLRVVNTTGSLNRLTLSGTTIGTNSTTTGDDGLFFEAQAAATAMNVTVQSGFFTASRGDLAQFNNSSSGTMDVVVSGTAFSDNHPAIVAGGGGVVVGAVSGTTTYNVNNNTFRDATGTAFAVSCGNAGVSCVGRIEGNQIGLAGTSNSGSTNASGIAVVSSGGGTITALVNNNTIRQYNNHGILLQAGQTGGNPTSFNVTVTNNTIGNPGTINTDFNGIHLNNGTLPGESFTSCVDIRNNSIAGSGTGVTVPNNADFRLRQRQSTTVRLPGYGGANNNDAAVVAFVSSNQTTITTGAASNTVPTGGGFVGGASCPTP